MEYINDCIIVDEETDDANDRLSPWVNCVSQFSLSFASASIEDNLIDAIEARRRKKQKKTPCLRLELQAEDQSLRLTLSIGQER